jgi:FKBP-type peptidyl-prolyl cis-trans isomerase
MKKYFLLILLFLFVFTLHAKGIQDEYNLADEKAQLSYAFGMLFGSNLRTTPLEFNYDAFTEGFKVMFEDTEPLLTEQEAIDMVEAAMQEAMDKAAEENRQRETEFLITNSQRPEIQTTSSGLQYEILTDTEDEKPLSSSIVLVKYEGSFIDGAIFDSSEDEGAFIPLEMVIPGWTEGIMLMSLGSIYRLYIPSNLAYGRSGVQGFIPPYSTLIFTIELLEIMNYDDDEEFLF